MCGSFHGDPSDPTDLHPLLCEITDLISESDAVDKNSILSEFLKKLGEKDGELAVNLFEYNKSFKENDGNEGHSAATNEEKDVNTLIYQAIYNLLPPGQTTPVKFWLCIDGDDVDDSITQYAPKTIDGHQHGI